MKITDDGETIDPKNYRFSEDPNYIITSPYHKEGGASGHKIELKDLKNKKIPEELPYENKFLKRLFQDIREQKKSE